MLEKYGIDDSKLLKIAVVATMSSGKSTFINALIGQEVLPSQNQACTAKVIPILDNDAAKEFKAYVEYGDGKKDIIALKDNKVVDGFNEKNEIKQILIEGDIKAIKNYNRATVIIDTPGTNFSGDSTHREETYKLLYGLEEGLILYIINATQFGINDDLELMLHIKEQIKKSKNKLKILFVVNKLDEFDCQREDIEQTMSSIYEYIEKNCIKNPIVISISALAAKLFRQALNGEQLTRRERREFENYYDLFKSNDYSLNKFAYIQSKKSKNIDICGKTFAEYDLLRAIDNTGINLVENAINELLFGQLNKYSPKVNFNQEEDNYHDNYEDNYDDKNEHNIDSIIKQTLKIYKNQEIVQKAEKIKLYAKNKKLNEVINEKLIQIYDAAYNESSKIMMKCVINKCSDNGSLRKIVDNAINNMEIVINNDKKGSKVIVNVMSGFADGKSTLIDSILGDNIVVRDLSHYNINYDLIDKSFILKELDSCDIRNMQEVCADGKNIIIYVINPSCLLTSGDKSILEMIANEMKSGEKKNKDRFIFVVSKCDEFDCENAESIPRLLKYVTEELSNFEIEKPNVFPVSARIAKLIRMNQKNIELTRRDKMDLRLYEDFIDLEGYHFEKMASFSESGRMKINHKLEIAKQEKNEYEEALIHTGIPSLEEHIQEYIQKHIL